MLEIMPIDSKELQRHAVSFPDTVYVKNSSAFIVKSDSGVLALCQALVNGGRADIISFSVASVQTEEHEMTARLLLLCVLSFLDRCGVRTVYLDKKIIPNVPSLLSYFSVGDDGIYYTEISGFFDRKQSEDPTK